MFEDPSIALADEMTANDIAGWDSLRHIDLILAMERHFGVRFATAEVSVMKAEGRNVGFLLGLLAAKLGQDG